ncbi:MAG: hypothetical protein ACRDUV_20650 [Pseudonocardiaceae bacterium]
MTLLRVQWLTQWRLGIPGVIIGLAVPWAALAAAAPVAGPYLLFIEVAAVGVFISGALVVADRAAGVSAALAVSPARSSIVMAARIAPLWGLTMLAAMPVVLVSRPQRPVMAMAAVSLTALLLLASGSGLAARRRTLMGFLTFAPWPLAPLLAVPLAVSAGLLTHPAWHAVPTTGALALMRGEAAYPAWLLLGNLTVWCVAVLIWAGHQGTTSGAPASAVRRGATTAPASWRRADLRNITREAIITPIALSPILLGLALRFGLPPLTSWADGAHGLDIAPYQPVIALAAVVLHVPVIAGMLGALIVLDDRDDGALQAILVSPLGARRYLGYRLTAVTVFAAAGLALSAPLSGQVPASGWAACLLAVPMAPAFTLAVLATAGNRVQGVTAVKALGVPSYAPLAALWLSGPAGWALGVLPGYWIITAWREPDPVIISCGIGCAALWIALLTPAATRRLTR